MANIRIYQLFNKFPMAKKQGHCTQCPYSCYNTQMFILLQNKKFILLIMKTDLQTLLPTQPFAHFFPFGKEM